MKYLIRAAILFIFSLPVYAGSFWDNLRYGIAVINQNQSLELNSGGSISTSSQSSTGFAVFAEKFRHQKYRFSGSLGLTSHPDNKIYNATVSADYLYPIDGRTALFGGVAAGGAGQQFDGASFSDISLGLLYGAQLGAAFYINRHLTIDLGYRLRITSLETKIASSSDVITTTGLDEIYLGFVIKL